MSERILPSVGFDRSLKLEWMDYALELALLGEPPEAMRKWLSSRVSGHDALRKTNNLLTNQWLIPYPETQFLRQQGLDLARHTPAADRLILHWGMALANFTLFRTTIQIMGRLLRLQGDFSTHEITGRVLEQYSNANTAGRSAARIVQSVASWGVIHNEAGRYSTSSVHSIVEPNLLEWLLTAVLITSRKRRWMMVDLLRANELFPFELGEQAEIVLHRSNCFERAREGLDQETVALSSACPHCASFFVA